MFCGIKDDFSSEKWSNLWQIRRKIQKFSKVKIFKPIKKVSEFP